MTYAESAASAQLAVKMVTTKLGGNSKSNSKSAKSITVPSYFLDRLNNATVSREYPTVTCFYNIQSFKAKSQITAVILLMLLMNIQQAKRLHDGHLQLLQEYFQQNDEFKIQLPTSKQTQLAIIQLEYDHETAAYQDHLYNLVLKPYGKLIYQQLPDFNSFTEANNTVAAYYLIDFASDVIPATTVFPLPNYRECSIPHYGKVSVNIISHLKFCTYCKTRGHSIKHCPLRPLRPSVNCEHCHTNTANHNYLSCAAIPVDAKLAAIEKLPDATIERALRTVYALKQIPVEVE
ncbi:hypothetical protein B5S32_g4891 [[Candida] boidinii]|nr:hypothetical protein B5S32_g4891 [[Candida] boidinii]